MRLLYELTDGGNWISEDDKGMGFIGGVNIPDARNELLGIDREIEDMLAQGARLSMHNNDLMIQNARLRIAVRDAIGLIKNIVGDEELWLHAQRWLKEYGK